MERPVALLDANVLYPARLRDLFLRLAIDGRFHARWSARILDECFDNLLADRPDLPLANLGRTRRLMITALPDAMVEGLEGRIARLELPDPDDRHVLAAAVAAEADLIVTANLSDFPSRSLPPALRAESPDAFVLSLIQSDADAVAAVVDRQAAALRHPPMTVDQLLDGFLELHASRAPGSQPGAVAQLRGGLKQMNTGRPTMTGS
ncbi:MAG: PIN domain-containing protein [Iamia sp.]